MGYGKKSKFKISSKPSTPRVAAPVPMVLHDVLTREQAKKAIHDALTKQYNMVINDVVICAVDILTNDFGKLQRRNGRLDNFFKLLMDRLQNIDQPRTEKQLAAYKKFTAETGMDIEDV